MSGEFTVALGSHNDYCSLGFDFADGRRVDLSRVVADWALGLPGVRLFAALPAVFLDRVLAFAVALALAFFIAADLDLVGGEDFATALDFVRAGFGSAWPLL